MRKKESEPKPIRRLIKQVVEVKYKDGNIIREFAVKDAPPMDRHTMISQTIVRYFN